MNVETSSSVPAPVQPAKGGATHARSRALGDDAASDSGASGFLSVLVSIGSPLSEPVVDGAPQNGAAVMPGDGPGQGQGSLFDPEADGLSPQAPIWLAAPMAQDAGRMAADGAAVGALVGTIAGAGSAPVTGSGRGAHSGMRAGSDPVGNAMAVEETLSQGDYASLPSNAGIRKGSAGLQNLAVSVSGLQDSGSVESPRDLLARLDSARAASDANSTVMRGAVVSNNGVAQPQLGSLFDAGAMNLRANTAWRSADRLGQRFGNSMRPAGMTPGAEAALPGTSHGASPIYAPGATTPVPATAVAEKVHYWVSCGVQNAKLQLAAFDGGSVDVSISVKGQEALVEFRTDQPQAQRLLLDAMPQLKEMLESEGLMLAGGFVGNSAQDGASHGRGRDRQRQAGRDAMVRQALPVAEQLAPAARMAGAPGGAIDLFV